MKGADEDQPVPKFLISCLLVIAVVSIKLSFSIQGYCRHFIFSLYLSCSSVAMVRDHCAMIFSLHGNCCGLLEAGLSLIFATETFYPT